MIYWLNAELPQELPEGGVSTSFTQTFSHSHLWQMPDPYLTSPQPVAWPRGFGRCTAACRQERHDRRAIARPQPSGGQRGSAGFFSFRDDYPTDNVEDRDRSGDAEKGAVVVHEPASSIWCAAVNAMKGRGAAHRGPLIPRSTQPKRSVDCRAVHAKAGGHVLDRDSAVFQQLARMRDLLRAELRSPAPLTPA